MNSSCFIHLKDLTLAYETHFDKTNNLKESVINFFTRRRPPVDKKSEFLQALNKISLSVQEGDRLGVVGLNGAGKSTLLKVISGILKPTSGTLNIKGSIQPLIEVGAGFDPEFTGRENIYLNGYMLGFTKKELKEKEQHIIDFSELGEFIDTPVKYYSSGMSVRLAFTIATVIRPEILLIDEMLGAGDAAFILKAKRRLDDLILKAKIIIVVSHDIAIINELCNRGIVMDKGHIVFDGKLPEALENYEKVVSKKLELSTSSKVSL